MQMFDFIRLYFLGEVFHFMHKHMRIILCALIGIAAQSMCVCVYHIRMRTQKKWKKKSDLQKILWSSLNECEKFESK